ncbi:hypothetical protein C483_07002 [Natrialba hulunbeirensis JCM 10989]|uniref:Uncharacterized protein n=1 Tax=Natrialba hulunbeirensis JCM 10989 TaxID=1227493 RepID=M0A1R3_9EURY|nr:hypothetical protein [Natrialba hulunbeirensis]ELY92695.1 hypothetical protein C483_07002 [Natrialba hulunbeirensis JCM 10989]
MGSGQELSDRLELAGPILVGILAVLFVYLILASRTGGMQWVVSIASFALTLFVIYLFYRLVIAVEEIAAKLE